MATKTDKARAIKLMRIATIIAVVMQQAHFSLIIDDFRQV